MQIDILLAQPSYTERRSFTASDSLALARNYIVSPDGEELTQVVCTSLFSYIGGTGVGHALIGAKIGAVLGTVLPGVGTVAGGILGFVVAKRGIEFIKEL